MKLDSMHHIAIIVSDYQASKSFYTDILGFQVIRETYREERDSYKLDLALGKTYVIELFSFPQYVARPSRPEALGLRHLAFSVKDIEAAIQELKAKNIFVEDVRVDEHTGRKFTFLFDPDQLPIELYEA